MHDFYFIKWHPYLAPTSIRFPAQNPWWNLLHYEYSYTYPCHGLCQSQNSWGNRIKSGDLFIPSLISFPFTLSKTIDTVWRIRIQLKQKETKVIVYTRASESHTWDVVTKTKKLDNKTPPSMFHLRLIYRFRFLPLAFLSRLSSSGKEREPPPHP